MKKHWQSFLASLDAGHDVQIMSGGVGITLRSSSIRDGERVFCLFHPVCSDSKHWLIAFRTISKLNEGKGLCVI